MATQSPPREVKADEPRHVRDSLKAKPAQPKRPPHEASKPAPPVFTDWAMI